MPASNTPATGSNNQTITANHRSVMDLQALRANIYTYLSGKLRDRATAEDLTQEVLLKMHQHLDQLQNNEKLLAWIKRISYNTLMDFYRKQPKDTRPLAQPPSEEPVDEAGNQALQGCILALMNGLSGEEQALLEAVEIKGVTQAVLARQLNIPFSTVKSRVQRAKTKIRKQIQSNCFLQLDPYGNVVDYQLPAT